MALEKQKRYTFQILALISSIFCLLTFNLGLSQAADIPVEVWVEGDVSISFNGDWENMHLSTILQVPGHEITQVGAWEAVPLEDYITFTDDTDVPGFYVTINMEDWGYSGADPYQGSISATMFQIIGNYDLGTPKSVTIGFDDPSYNLSILPSSCQSIAETDFTFHNDFYNSENNYALTASNQDIIILESSGECLNLGHIRFDRTQLTVGPENAKGTYTSVMTITIIDGMQI